jgi:HEAT repeat protein
MKKTAHEPSVASVIKDVKILADTAIEDKDPMARKHAIYLIGLSRSPGCIPILIQGLRDPEKSVRAQAVKALVAIGQSTSDALIGLLKDPDWKVRYRAAEALGMIRDEHAVTSLITLLHDDKDHVRYMAAKSLGMMKPQSAREPLCRSLNDENEYVKAMAASALLKIGN